MSDTRPQARSPFISLMGLLIAGFLGLFSEAALNIALPDLMEVFSVSAAIVQWLTTAYLLAVGVVLPLFGLVSRWLSTRQLAVIANAAFILGAVVCALSADFGMLILGRVLQGIATGIMLPLLFSAAISVYPLAQRGKALGMIGLVVMFAPAVSPVVAGLILEVATWEWIFWVTVPVMAAALVLSLAKLPNVRELSRPHIDMLSIVSSVIGFGGLVLGVSVGGEQGWTSPVVAISLLVGLLSLAVFVRRQLRSAQPFLEMRAFTSRAFSTGAIVIGLLSAVLMCTIFLIPMYLQDARLMSVLAAAFIMLPGGVVNGVLSAAAGRASDLLPPRRLIQAGTVLTCGAAVVFAGLGQASALVWVVVAHCVLMVGIPLAVTPAQANGLREVPQAYAADGSTIYSTVQQIGGAIGTAVGASLLSAAQAAQAGDAVAGTVTGTHHGYIAAIVMAVIAVIAALWPRHRISGR